MDLSDEAWQAAEGGREEGCADSSSVAPLYTLLCRPLALWTALAVTDDFLVFYEIATYMPLTVLINMAVKFEGKVNRCYYFKLLMT